MYTVVHRTLIKAENGNGVGSGLYFNFFQDHDVLKNWYFGNEINTNVIFSVFF
jgi:hypothetical protein